jgi:hypothetical protein
MGILQPCNWIHISLNGLCLFQINNFSKRNNTLTHILLSAAHAEPRLSYIIC